MKLLVVSQYFWPENFRINDLVAELVKRGHEVTVLTGKPNYPEGKIFEEFRLNPDSFSHYQGARIVRVPLVPRGKGGLNLLMNYLSFAFFGSLLGPFLLRKHKFDAIFVCQLSPVIIAVPAIVMRSLRHIPSIHWVLDLWPKSLEAVGVVRSPLILGWLDHLVGLIYRSADLVLGQSRSFLPEIDRHLKAGRSSRYFPSWAEPLQPLGEVTAAPEIEARADVFNVMFAGNIGEAQDFPAILAAADMVKDRPVRWLIVGDGRQADWVKNEIARRGLEQNVIMTGRFPLERMPSVFKHADALLVSLRDEPIFSMTIPGKVQSYLATGRPILAMLSGEGARVVAEAGAGVVVPASDHVALADAVSELAGANERRLYEMGRGGKLYLEREFDRSNLINSLEQMFTELSMQSPQ